MKKGDLESALLQILFDGPEWQYEKQLGIGVNGTTPDGLFSVEAVRCIGCCGLAPAVVVNGEVHGKLTAKDVSSVIAKYRELG